MAAKNKILVTVDKSHLITLGERMYPESVELIRELVNNAYDADATQVFVEISNDKIMVRDNGTGMSDRGLEQYFNVGSLEKRIHPKSPKFGRKRIGEFGIGKFASLSAADSFEVRTKKGKFLRRVIFSQKEWQDSQTWELPIKKEIASAFEKDGTVITLTKLKKEFNLSEVEKVLREAVPLRVKNFSVYLNRKRTLPSFVPGRKIPISQKTIFGEISGEIVVAVNPRLVKFPGILCRVKGVGIKRELFDLENVYTFGINRICGEVNADFLPVNTARNDFIRDDLKYKLFYKIMRANLEKVLIEIKKFSDIKTKRKLTTTLKEVIAKVREALIKNPELCPSGRLLKKRKAKEMTSEVFSSVSLREKKAKEPSLAKAAEGKEEKVPKIRPSPEAIMKRFRIKDFGVICCIDHLGQDGPESVSTGNIVYINQGHPVYLKCSKRKELNFFNLSRLIMQEIALMKERKSFRKVFDHQSRLLKGMIK